MCTRGASSAKHNSAQALYSSRLPSPRHSSRAEAGGSYPCEHSGLLHVLLLASVASIFARQFARVALTNLVKALVIT